MDQKTSSNVNQHNGEGMKKEETSSTEEGGKRVMMLLDTVEALFQDQEKRGAVSDIQMRKLQKDIEKHSKNQEKLRDLLVAMIRERKFDGRILGLKEEQEALRKRIVARKLQIGEQEISRLKYLITTMKGVVTEDDIAGKQLIDEMKEQLRKLEGQVESLKL